MAQEVITPSHIQHEGPAQRAVRDKPSQERRLGNPLRLWQHRRHERNQQRIAQQAARYEEGRVRREAVEHQLLQEADQRGRDAVRETYPAYVAPDEPVREVPAVSPQVPPDEEAPPYAKHSIPRYEPSRFRKFVAAVVALGALGFSGGDKAAQHVDHEVKPNGSVAAATVSGRTESSGGATGSLTSKVTIPEGGSFWKASKQQEKALGEPQDAVTNIVTQIAADKNHLEDPDHINPGEYQMPSPDAIAVIQDGILPPGKHATKADKQFHEDLQLLNSGEKLPNRVAILARVEAHIQSELPE